MASLLNSGGNPGKQGSASGASGGSAAAVVSAAPNPVAAMPAVPPQSGNPGKPASGPLKATNVKPLAAANHNPFTTASTQTATTPSEVAATEQEEQANAADRPGSFPVQQPVLGVDCLWRCRSASRRMGSRGQRGRSLVSAVAAGGSSSRIAERKQTRQRAVATAHSTRETATAMPGSDDQDVTHNVRKRHCLAVTRKNCPPLRTPVIRQQTVVPVRRVEG
jgi:hypothetical protein